MTQKTDRWTISGPQTHIPPFDEPNGFPISVCELFPDVLYELQVSVFDCEEEALSDFLVGKATGTAEEVTVFIDSCHHGEPEVIHRVVTYLFSEKVQLDSFWYLTLADQPEARQSVIVEPPVIINQFRLRVKTCKLELQQRPVLALCFNQFGTCGHVVDLTAEQLTRVKRSQCLDYL